MTVRLPRSAHELRALDVEYFFLVTGRDTALWIALQAAGIRQVLARSESGAVYMADAYARITGRPTFVYGDFGPGAANVAGGARRALWSRSPLIALPSAMRRAARYRRSTRSSTRPSSSRAVTKWAAEAAVPAQVPRLLRDAVRHALGGTPGPVYLGIPGDVLEEEVPGYQEPVPPSPEPPRPVAATPTGAEAEGVLGLLRGRRLARSSWPATASTSRRRTPPAHGGRAAGGAGGHEHGRQGEHPGDDPLALERWAATRGSTRTPRCARRT